MANFLSLMSLIFPSQAMVKIVLTARFSRPKDADKAKYEVLLTFSSELAGTQDFDHGEQDRLSAFQKFLPLALFDNRNQLAVRSPMPPAFAGQQLALSYDPQNGLHSILTSSGEIQAYSEARLSSVGNVEQLPSFPTGKNVTVDFFTDRGVNHVLTVQPNHQVDRWKGEEHQAFSWHYPRWGSSRPNGNRVVLSPGSDDFVISDGVSLYHHAVSGGWRPLKSPLNGRPLLRINCFHFLLNQIETHFYFQLLPMDCSQLFSK